MKKVIIGLLIGFAAGFTLGEINMKYDKTPTSEETKKFTEIEGRIIDEDGYGLWGTSLTIYDSTYAIPKSTFKLKIPYTTDKRSIIEVHKEGYKKVYKAYWLDSQIAIKLENKDKQ